MNDHLHNMSKDELIRLVLAERINHRDALDALLDMTEHEQNVLAEFCSIARAAKYSMITNAVVDETAFVAHVGQQVVDLLERFSITPQGYDRMYDRLHRSGKNSE